MSTAAQKRYKKCLRKAETNLATLNSHIERLGKGATRATRSSAATQRTGMFFRDISDVIFLS